MVMTSHRAAGQSRNCFPKIWVSDREIQVFLKKESSSCHGKTQKGKTFNLQYQEAGLNF